MAVTNWWTVDDARMLIMGGPFLWDGVTTWTPPVGQRAVNANPIGSGYSWPTDPYLDMEWPTVCSRLAALEARLSAEARGVAVLPAIALLETKTVQVPLKTAMPSTAYTPSALLIGSPVAGNLTVQSATAFSKQRVDVAIKATAAVSLGAASVLVFADA